MINEVVLYTLIALPLADFFWKYYILKRQLKLCTESPLPPTVLRPVVPSEVYDGFRIFTVWNINQWCYSKTYNAVVWSFLLFWQTHSALWYLVSDSINPSDNSILTSFVWLCIQSFFLILLYLPMNFMETIIMQEISPTFIDYVIRKLIYIPIMLFLTVTIKFGGKYFYFWYWLLASTAFLTMHFVQLNFSFSEPSPLQNVDLKRDIENLCQEVQFSLRNVWVTDKVFGGLHNNYINFRHDIILFQTLFDESVPFLNDEILALVAHQIAHCKKFHPIIKLLLEEMWTFVVVFLYFQVLQLSTLYTALGFDEGDKPIAVAVVVLKYSLVPIFTLCTYLKNCAIKKMEYDADSFCVSIGKGEALKRALLKLHNFEFGFPLADPLYSAWLLRYPLLYDRIKKLED